MRPAARHVFRPMAEPPEERARPTVGTRAFGGVLLTALALGPLAVQAGAFLLVLFSSTLARADFYTVTDLGTLGGSRSNAYAVNNAGQVVGFSFVTNDSAERAFLYSGTGPMIDLGTLGGQHSYAFGINNLGQVVGTSFYSSGGDLHAFLSDGSAMTDLGTLGGAQSTATNINDLGQVVGWSNLVGSSAPQAFLYSGGAMTALGTLGGLESAATAINNSGLVVGLAQNASGAVRAFLYDGSVMADLGTLGGDESAAQGINGTGSVVGRSATAAGGTHAFLYEGGSMIDLGVLGNNPANGSTANDLNALGQVVGGSRADDGSDRAFLWSNGVMLDLNTLLPADSGWFLTEAREINDSGQIVGYGVFAGQYPRAFLLTPVPAPSARSLMGIGALCLIGYVWRRRVRTHRWTPGERSPILPLSIAEYNHGNGTAGVATGPACPSCCGSDSPRAKGGRFPPGVRALFRIYVSNLLSDWVALVSGIASFILMGTAAIWRDSLPVWLFWPAAYVCLAIAGYRLWSKEYRARKAAEDKLTAQGPKALTEANVRSQLATLSHAEMLALKHLVVCGQLTEAQLEDFCRRNGLERVNPARLAERLTFLTREPVLAAWHVIPSMKEAVEKVLAEIRL